MQYISHYDSLLGEIIITSNGEELTGLWFDGQKYSDIYLEKNHIEKELPIFIDVKQWLDIYFSGNEPDFKLPIKFDGTNFQKEVWEILCSIPYGQTVTYGDIAKELAKRRGITRMSAQAVGGAVGRNKISIIIPCHRVVGTNGSLTGYAGGITRKIELLKLENAF